MATYNTELSRKGPGLLLRDILKGSDPQLRAVQGVIQQMAPDILILQDLDYDLTGAALHALAQSLGYDHQFLRAPNTGVPTGLDMDGDGEFGTARDAQGFGYFSGQGGMAILSHFPVVETEAQDFSALLWRDVPGALLPTLNGQPFPSAAAQEVQRLSSTGHWVVPIDTPLGRVSILAFHATPPVFDGPEDRNGRRNHDEILLWTHVLDGHFGEVPQGIVIAGDANLDPVDGDGLKVAITTLLSDQRLQDPTPQSLGGLALGGDASDTVDWRDPIPGNLRVDYVLPSIDWHIKDSGVFWPTPDDPALKMVETASRHRMVWVDLER